MDKENSRISKEYLEEKGFIKESSKGRFSSRYTKREESFINQWSTISITLYNSGSNQICLDYNTETGMEDTSMHMYPRISKVSELEELLKMLDIN